MTDHATPTLDVAALQQLADNLADLADNRADLDARLARIDAGLARCQDIIDDVKRLLAILDQHLRATGADPRALSLLESAVTRMR